MTNSNQQFHREVIERLDRLEAIAADGGFDEAIDLLANTIASGGVIQAFGTGHSEAFAMEIAGRAGGLIPTTRIALRDLVLAGGRDPATLGDNKLERDASFVDELLAAVPIDPRDAFIIASNSGVNGSIVGVALAVKERGHKLIAVTSLEHTNAVTPKHPSGQRLSDIADIVIDNLAPYGDTTMHVGEGDQEVGVGAVSSITAAYIAQLFTIGVAERLATAGETAPVYLSANIPGGDAHNHVLEDRYAGRIRRGA